MIARRFHRTPIAAAFLATFSAQAAEPTPTELPEVQVEGETVKDYRTEKVSSPKYTEPLRDTPQTIVVIPKEVYQQQGQTSLRDVLRNTPGITLQQGEGGAATGDNIFLRGFSARNDVFVDGVRDPGVVARDTFNVDQVEVAKGPSSAITGRGSTGGSINLVSKMARAEDFSIVTGALGTDAYKRATFDTNQKFGESSAVRLNMMAHDADVAGRDVVTNQYLGFAPSVGFGLGKPTQLFLNFMHLEQDNIPDYGLPVTLPGVNGGTANTTTNPPVNINDVDWSNFYGLKSRDFERVKSDLGTVMVEHQVSDSVKLRNLTRYGKNVRDAVVTPPRAATPFSVTPVRNGNGDITSYTFNFGSTLDPGYDPTQPQIRRTDTKYQDRADEIAANQTFLTWNFDTAAVRHAVVTGLEFSQEKSKTYVRADRCVPASTVSVAVTPDPNAPQPATPPPPALPPGCASRPPVTSVFNPNPGDSYRPSLYRTGAFSDATGNSVAAYAFDTLKFGERWEFLGGLRLERFDAEVTNVVAAGTPPNTTSGTATRLSQDNDLVSWRAAVIYKPVEQASIYGGASTSFNPSSDGAQGIALATTGVNRATLDPEKNRAYEIGTKWELLDRRLFATAALFRSEKTNARTNATIAGQAVTILAGKQKIDGVELGLTGSPNDKLTLFGGYVYMDSVIEKSAVPAEVDQDLQYVPEHSLNLWSTYAFMPKWLAGFGVQFTDGYNLTNSPAVTPNPNRDRVEENTKYALMNGMVSYDWSEKLTLQLNGLNLGDEQYVERANTGHFTPGATRSFIASATYKF